MEALGIHPLTAEQQASYGGDWTAIQERFVDAPAAAVSAADTLIWDVMRDRGYPADNRDASVEALSVYHARPLDGYRQAQDIRTESATTEELRDGHDPLPRAVPGPGGRGRCQERRPCADNGKRAAQTADTPRSTGSSRITAIQQEGDSMTQDPYGQPPGAGYVVRGEVVPDDEANVNPPTVPMTHFQKVASALRGDRTDPG